MLVDFLPMWLLELLLPLGPYIATGVCLLAGYAIWLFNLIVGEIIKIEVNSKWKKWRRT
jgi:hypothetical protein